MNTTNLDTAATATVTTRGHSASREDILAAIALCDELGQSAFLELHGYRDSVRYHLRHDGRSYPSKAILGVALDLKSADFFGGARETVRMLGELGFHVRNSSTGEMVDELGLEAIRTAMIKAGFDDPAPAWPTLPVAPSAYFASGSNRPGEIAALGKIGADIGVAAPELSEAAIVELEKLAGSDVLVFIDSGAFSEVRFTDAGVEVVKPITDAEWVKRLELYKRLARTLGPSLYCVAPDQVGNQTVTLERLRRYRADLFELRELGARVLVPIQKGKLSQHWFAIKVSQILGTEGWLPAIPCKKAATSPAELREFLETSGPYNHIHLLGLGITNPKVNEYLAPFVDLPREPWPATRGTSVSLDSCWIAANVGRNQRKDGSVRVRRYTKARDIAARVLKALGRLTDRTKVEAAIYACLAAPLTFARSV
jgi:hypothetical protein